MSLLTTKNLSKAFGADEIFGGVSVDVQQGARIALVGPNGAGKTTLLHILLDMESPTTGEVYTRSGLRMGFLPQRPQLDGQQTLWQEMMTAFTHFKEMERRLQALEEALADPARADEQAELLDKYGRLQETYQFKGGYRYHHETERVLHGLGFGDDDHDMPLDQLSGGQVTRALLARLLLESPDLLILDEPTNHLDIRAVEWLESYLNAWEGAVLMVSHDRYFMDKTVETIWELDFGGLEVYRGNYSHYVRQREERRARRLKEYEAQQAFIEKEQEYIRRNIAGQNTKQAQGRRKRLERLLNDRDQPVFNKPQERDAPSINLSASRTGKLVFRTKGLDIGYADDPDGPLFETPDITLLRGEVAAIIGPNGAGKSTFLKSILGQHTPLAGTYEWGAKVKIGYFAQAHEDLNPDHTVLDEILNVKNMPLTQARSYLASYLFTGDDAFRKVATLSGGERGRLALAKLALMGANVLLLDEPTNHLDIAAQEVLEAVLADFNGTILLVSHDRYLIDALATQIWAIDPGQMIVFEGSYQDYERWRKAQQEAATTSEAEADSAPAQEQSTSKERPHGLNPYQRRKRVAQLEGEIHDLEAELADVSAALQTASQAGEIEKVAELGQRYADLEKAINARMEEWAELA